eukprot:1850389-Rhodomonas_salina.11
MEASSRRSLAMDCARVLILLHASFYWSTATSSTASRLTGMQTISRRESLQVSGAAIMRQSKWPMLQLRGGGLLSSEDSDPDFDLNKETPKQKEKRLKSAEADAFMRMWEFNQTVAPVSHDLPTGNNIQGFTEIARAGIRALDMKKRMEKLEAGTEAEQLNADALDFDKEAEDFPTTAEGMFEFLLNMHNEVEERFGTQREKEAALSRELKMEEREEEEEQSSSSEPEIVTDEYTGMTFNMSKTEAELLAQIGVYEIPVATAEDFEQAESVFPPTAKSAVAAWDLFKGKDKGGFDTVCMRHRVWGTEIEFFIGSTGRLKLRPTEKHQVQLLYADGTWYPPSNSDPCLGVSGQEPRYLSWHWRRRCFVVASLVLTRCGSFSPLVLTRCKRARGARVVRVLARCCC